MTFYKIKKLNTLIKTMLNGYDNILKKYEQGNIDCETTIGTGNCDVCSFAKNYAKFKETCSTCPTNYTKKAVGCANQYSYTSVHTSNAHIASGYYIESREAYNNMQKRKEFWLRLGLKLLTKPNYWFISQSNLHEIVKKIDDLIKKSDQEERGTFYYNQKTKEITIQYPDYGTEGRNYGNLFGWLSDFDVVTGSELGDDIILLDGLIYFLTSQKEIELARTGKITLSNQGHINDYRKDNPDFYNWYYSKTA